jgi:hypothetical protein
VHCTIRIILPAEGQRWASVDAGYAGTCFHGQQCTMLLMLHKASQAAMQQHMSVAGRWLLGHCHHRNWCIMSRHGVTCTLHMHARSLVADHMAAATLGHLPANTANPCLTCLASFSGLQQQLLMPPVPAVTSLPQSRSALQCCSCCIQLCAIKRGGQTAGRTNRQQWRGTPWPSGYEYRTIMYECM